MGVSNARVTITNKMEPANPLDPSLPNAVNVGGPRHVRRQTPLTSVRSHAGLLHVFLLFIRQRITSAEQQRRDGNSPVRSRAPFNKVSVVMRYS